MHRGEAIDEESRIGAQDMVLRFEPGDVVFFILFLNCAKPDEGAHLVNVAPHAASQIAQAAHIGIGGILHQAGPRLQAPEQAVKQGKA